MLALPSRPHSPPALLTGADALVHGFVGRWHRRGAVLSELIGLAARTDSLAPSLRDLAGHAFRARMESARAAVRRGRDSHPDVLTEALAVVREAARRTLELEAFPVQLAGTMALHRGLLAEMATGEGKTLTAGLAAVLFGWTGRPCHVVTVNDYLVERDAAFLRPLLEACGLTAGHVTASMPPDERAAAYRASVVWATSRELAADFLRDRLQRAAADDPARRLLDDLRRRQAAPALQRGLHTAIIDEADSLLIDEAVTPLIISTRVENAPLREAVLTASRLAQRFSRDAHYHITPRHREIEFTADGERLLGACAPEMEGLWRAPARTRELLRTALAAREFHHRGQHYLVDDGKVVIVDEFTGRPMPDRSWRQGLHQAVEALEGLEITPPSDTLARISFQRFFRRYHRLCGMTGTARETAAEFWHVYGLAVVPIPTNRPCLRRSLPLRCFPDREAKLDAIVEAIGGIHASGAPALVGTRSVAASEDLAARLAAAGLPCRVLNATRLREEAMIVAAAGEPRRITIATNMAGRGTDIRLQPGAAAAGGLHVIATEPSESGRVDRQLHGRSARQGDPGVASSFAAADDDLLVRFCPAPLRNSLAAALKRDLPGAQHLAAGLIARAQRTAQRHAALLRRRVLESDTWLDASLSFTGPDRF